MESFLPACLQGIPIRGWSVAALNCQAATQEGPDRLEDKSHTGVNKQQDQINSILRSIWGKVLDKLDWG